MDQTAPGPAFFRKPNGPKAPPPFSRAEYAARLAALRAVMAARDASAVVLTSMHNIAYLTGFLYCSFGRAYACVVTNEAMTLVTANIDAGQPERRAVCPAVTYTDWARDNYERAIVDLLGPAARGRVGVEGDHLTLTLRDRLAAALPDAVFIDVAGDLAAQRMVKSAEEIALIREGARIADIGGAAMKAQIRPGVREIDVAMAGRDAMECEIARAFPDSELRDSWCWFQSGLNTDGAHNPVTTRALQHGDILSLNAFPMISGYYTALERTLFLGEPDAASARAWAVNVATHELGLSLIRPGVSCRDICTQLNAFLAEEGLLERRSFGYGHSFGLLSHYYGREAGLELREDVDTVLAPGMVVSMEPMLWIPEGEPGAGGYREHDILVVEADGAANITGFPFGPAANIVAA